METSFANGGLLTPSMPEPWNGPGAFRQLLRSLVSDDSPMLLRKRTFVPLVPWGIGFLWYSLRRYRERAIRANFALAEYSQHLQKQLETELPLDRYDGRKNGTMKVFRDDRSFMMANKGASQLAKLGLKYKKADVNLVLQLEPALNDVQDSLVGGLFYPNDRSGDAHKFCSALGALCKARGVKFRFREEVQSIRLKRGRVVSIESTSGHHSGDAFVLATGSFTPRLLRPIGVGVPIRPCKGYSVTLPIGEWTSPPSIPVIDDNLHAAVTPLGSTIRIAGTAEFDGFNATISKRRIHKLTGLLKHVYPSYKLPRLVKDSQTWAGFRPVSVDGIPMIGQTRLPNLYLNAGHFHLGWTLAVGSGKVLAAKITSQPTEIDGEAYDPRRFS